MIGTMREILEKHTTAAQRVTSCLRRGCGAVAVASVGEDDQRLFQTCSSAVNGSSSCKAAQGSCGCPHAEQRLIVGMLQAISTFNRRRHLVLLTTLAPCPQCANLILLSDLFRSVIYLLEYDTDTSGPDILKRGGVSCHQLV